MSVKLSLLSPTNGEKCNGECKYQSTLLFSLSCLMGKVLASTTRNVDTHLNPQLLDPASRYVQRAKGRRLQATALCMCLWHLRRRGSCDNNLKAQHPKSQFQNYMST